MSRRKIDTVYFLQLDKETQTILLRNVWKGYTPVRVAISVPPPPKRRSIQRRPLPSLAPKVQTSPYSPRTRFTLAQTDYLESVFKKNRYPSRKEYKVIVEKTKLEKKVIQGWFSRMRMKHGSNEEKKERNECTK